jgi:hypothetical protein
MDNQTEQQPDTVRVKAKLYIGTKLILAVPQARNGVDGYRVGYPDGYESWSPKDTFDAAYREVTEQERSLF